ncbi:MAG: flavodoxin family protein [Deltaproteobacteria bacterium]|nr:flavodoxin family protein [Deltaproteobacteria bacterium]
MRKVLGIIGSPRKLGNCELMVKEIANRIPEKHHLSLLRLADFDIRLCRGCYNCLTDNGNCKVRDDFPMVARAMAEADAFIVAVPTYFLGPNASLKLLLDRSMGFSEQVWGKPAVGVVLAGMEGKEGYARLGLLNFLSLILADIKGVEVVYAALPGEAVIEDKNLNAAKRLGAALFGHPLPKGSPACPVCGSDTFRFVDRFHVQCMLCSNPGTLDTSSGRPAFLINRSDHGFFLAPEGAKTHKQWLRDMKKKFSEKRKELKEAALSYLRDGDWIKPEKGVEPEEPGPA